jgi:hypothetical protein
MFGMIEITGTVMAGLTVIVTVVVAVPFSESIIRTQ